MRHAGGTKGPSLRETHMCVCAPVDHKPIATIDLHWRRGWWFLRLHADPAEKIISFTIFFWRNLDLLVRKGPS